jgi:hypothetical protein
MRRRHARFVFFACSALAIVSGVSYLTSLRFRLACHLPLFNGSATSGVGAGSFMIGWTPIPIQAPTFVASDNGFRFVIAWPTFFSMSGEGMILVPLWIPLVCAITPALFLFGRTKAPPAGHCALCGYNLVGGDLGVCPECGKPAA